MDLIKYMKIQNQYKKYNYPIIKLNNHLVQIILYLNKKITTKLHFNTSSLKHSKQSNKQPKTFLKKYKILKINNLS